MIPTLLLVGLVGGAFVHDRTSLIRCSKLCVAAAVLWGAAVGVAAETITTFLGGAALALANLVFGAVFAAAARCLLGRLFGGRRPPQPHCRELV